MLRVVTCFLLLAAFSPNCLAQATVTPVSAKPVFKRVGIMPTRPQAASATPKYNGITYNGGPIIDDANGVNVYYIWYGDWSKNTAAQTILTHFITHYGGSPNANINTTYYDYEVGPNGTQVVKDRVVNTVHYMGSTSDHYSFGVNLTDNDVGLVVQNAVADGRLPLDRNGVYFVLTSADVMETSGFCTSYCAFHGVQQGALGNLLAAFVGNPEQCPMNCTSQPVLPTPNMNVGADGMASFVAHELEESVTDPLCIASPPDSSCGWINSDGSENEDLCQLTYGKTYTLPNGSFANMKLGNRQYLIQQNWVNANGGYCAKSWDE
jgi:hypothetical protein